MSYVSWLFQAGTSALALQLKSTELVARWEKKKSGKLYEQSAQISDDGIPWEPSDVVYLGGLPTTLWNILKEETNAISLKGFTGYVYSLTVNGKVLSLKGGTVYSEDGLINAFGASEAGDEKFNCFPFKKYIHRLFTSIKIL